MRQILFILPFALAGCNSAESRPSQEAESCVATHAGSHSKVSAERARQIIGECQKGIEKWLDASMRNSCRGPCNYRDPTMAQERVHRKSAIEEHLMMGISDEVHPKFVRM